MPGQGLPAEPREARPTYELDAYLGELVSRLDCDPLRRDEIRLEVHSHLRELLEKENREGKSPAEAARAAIAQFGTADEVARRLAPVNRGRVPTPLRASPGWRVLAVVAALIASWVALFPAQFYLPRLLAYVAFLGRPHGAAEAVIVADVAMYLPWGPTAALVAWAVSRRPWDSLFACPLLLVMSPAGGNHFWSWLTYSVGLAQAATVLVGAILAAYLLSKREKRLALTRPKAGLGLP